MATKSSKHLAIFLTLSILLHNYQNITKIKNKEEISLLSPNYKTSITKTLNDPNELYSYINSNTNLDKTEKQIINGSWNFIEDYYQSLDYDYITTQLQKFDIKYEKISPTFSGTWNTTTSTITLYGLENKTQILEKQSAANHEFIHLLSNGQNNIPPFLKEGIDALICLEYDISRPSYKKQYTTVQLLCEIINPDLIIKSYLQGDINIIKQELLKIDNDPEKLEELFTCFDNYHQIFMQQLSLVSQNQGLLDDEQLKQFKDNANSAYGNMQTIDIILKDYLNKNTTLNKQEQHNQMIDKYHQTLLANDYCLQEVTRNKIPLTAVLQKPELIIKKTSYFNKENYIEDQTKNKIKSYK